MLLDTRLLSFETIMHTYYIVLRLFSMLATWRTFDTYGKYIAYRPAYFDDLQYGTVSYLTTKCSGSLVRTSFIAFNCFVCSYFYVLILCVPTDIWASLPKINLMMMVMMID